MEHLVVLPQRTIRRLSRQRAPVLEWTRRRREPPVGAVRRGETLYFKASGGDVVALASVARVTERFHHGRYRVRMRLRRLAELPLSFPVVKRDRRSWVVCAGVEDENQQALLAVPAPTLDDLLRAARRHYRALPSAREIDRALRALVARRLTPERDVGVLLLLAMLLAARTEVTPPASVRTALRKLPSRVFPFAVFS